MTSFEQGTRELERIVGHGKLVGKLEVDQVYAAPLEVGYWKTGPLAGVTNRPRHGGETHALANALQHVTPKAFQRMADHAYDEGGLAFAMISDVEDLSGEYHDRAPREFEDLRNSGHPTVTDNGKRVYDRPPLRSRLTDAQLAEKSRRRALGEGLTSTRRTGPTLPFSE